tara:strand:- start:355 stop:840 length:486 start_codon:yes stop_codon:yes gene_type:complete
MSKNIKLLNTLIKGKQLKKSINDQVAKAIKEIGYNVKHQLVNSWSTKTPPHIQGQYHLHNNFWLSAVYYPHGNLSDNYGIQFKSNRTDFTNFDIPINNYNILNSTTWEVNVEKGDLLIFPALLTHKIKKNISTQDRYSIAINLLPLGKIGTSDGYMEYKKI